MLKEVSPARWVGVWFVAVAICTVASIVLGADLTARTSAMLVAMSLVPPAVMLLVFRGAPPLTVAEILHAVESQPKDVR
jgi:hypothetical protein